jgi:hypothetical protein
MIQPRDRTSTTRVHDVEKKRSNCDGGQEKPTDNGKDQFGGHEMFISVNGDGAGKQNSILDNRSQDLHRIPCRNACNLVK